MAIVWHPSLEIGLQVIDDQHRHFVALVNGLLEALEQGRAAAALEPLAAALEQYAASHFRMEEAAMQEHGYPDLAAHRASHQQFRERVTALAAEIHGGRPGMELVMRYGQLLQQWLRDHIANEDRRIGTFLRERGAQLV
jgi:hemerythrin